MDNINFYSSGFLIQTNFPNFKGISEENIWPLDNFNDKYLKYEYYLEKYVTTIFDDPNRVDLCTDVDFLEEYYKSCLFESLDINILFCMTARKKPAMKQSTVNIIIENSEFLGFDYAFPGYDYYSSVYWDIHKKRFPEFANIELNSNGLFQQFDDVLAFSKKREYLKTLVQNSEQGFEQGEFVIYKIWRTNLDVLQLIKSIKNS